MVKGEEHIVRLRIDTTLHGPLAIQYKLLRLLKNSMEDEKKFLNSLLLIGLTRVSRVLLRNLVDTSLFNKLFKNFDDEELK